MVVHKCGPSISPAGWKWTCKVNSRLLVQLGCNKLVDKKVRERTGERGRGRGREREEREREGGRGGRLRERVSQSYRRGSAA